MGCPPPPTSVGGGALHPSRADGYATYIFGKHITHRVRLLFLVISYRRIIFLVSKIVLI
jgi:hypothetical protein